jgi:hypothetical protein
MGPLMAAARSRRSHADRSICVRCGRSCSASATKALDADLVRTIHGFDALLVLTGSTASANL